MKGEGGVLSAISIFWKMIFLKTIQNHSLTVKTYFALSLGITLCIYIPYTIYTIFLMDCSDWECRH